MIYIPVCKVISTSCVRHLVVPSALWLPIISICPSIGRPKVCPLAARNTPVSACLNITFWSRCQKSPSQTTFHTSPVSPTPASPKADTSCWFVSGLRRREKLELLSRVEGEQLNARLPSEVVGVEVPVGGEVLQPQPLATGHRLPPLAVVSLLGALAARSINTSESLRAALVSCSCSP